ncbi:MAG: hypothetical protein AB1696_17080 [Planctomycetota bacterium]
MEVMSWSAPFSFGQQAGRRDGMRKAFAVFLCVAFGFAGVSDVKAQSKKKGKEIPTQICERGKLIFEDDFSGKEILWLFNDASPWKLAGGKLVSKQTSTEHNKQAYLHRKIESSSGIVVQFLVPPEEKIAYITVVALGGGVPQYRGKVDLRNQICEIQLWGKEKIESLSSKQLPATKLKVIPILYEATGGKFAVTVLGQTAIHDAGVPDMVLTDMRISFYARSVPVLIALDDVKVWEALPKGK